MAAKTYKARAIVLRKTKLGENDLIVTMLSSDGSLLRAVAKGARKPGGRHSARAEIFSTVDALLAEGRNLDVLCEERIVGDVHPHELTLEQTSAMAPVAELLCAVAQDGLEQPRLFDLAQASFNAIGIRNGNDALLAACAALLKIIAQAGFRPSFDHCVLCSRELDLGSNDSLVGFSVSDGGAVCPDCTKDTDILLLDSNVLDWCNYLIKSRYDDLVRSEDGSVISAVLRTTNDWIAYHIDKQLKSIHMISSIGMLNTE